MKLGRVALDGTKIKANASKHKAMSWKRMNETEQRLRREVGEILAEAEQVDEAEDARWGEARGDELPEELARRQSRLERIREAKKALRQRARERAEAAGQAAEPAQPEDKDQYNFSDPQSRIMKGAEGFVQAYNAQAAVEPATQIIVGQSLTNEANDKKQLKPLVEAIEKQSGQRPQGILADSGYCSEANLEYAASEREPEKAIEAWVATGRGKHSEKPQKAPRGRPAAGLTRVQKMRRKLLTKAGRKIYSQRKAIVEPVFGQIKQARGIRQFLLRGLEKARGEWGLICLTHNVLKMHGLVMG